MSEVGPFKRFLIARVEEAQAEQTRPLVGADYDLVWDRAVSDTLDRLWAAALPVDLE